MAQGHCHACKVYPALTPSFIEPHKHYAADVIERVIKEAEAGNNIEKLGGCSADISTMRRWVREWAVRVGRAVTCLASYLATVRKAQVDLHELTTWQQLIWLLGEFPASERGGVLGRVNTILTTHNCGFL